ncbi:MAG TPA: DUF551 domain-containing protein [Methanosphaera sp.]|nr:DUF551 domain-containing protein [Methanosphaera sp.]
MTNENAINVLRHLSPPHTSKAAFDAFRQAIEMAVEALKEPQSEPHWIPCSERLPEVKQKVLVQYADESMATKRCNDAGHLAWFYSNAVAWMPAPEPYKEVTT